MQTNQSYNSKRGVTLTELAISVAIISFLIAGAFGGVTMLKAATIRKAVGEFTNYMTAINEFQSEYGYLPGDLPTASSYWATNPVTGATTHNGNGDGLVTPDGTEELYVWEHLGDAKLIVGNYTGLYSNNPTNTIQYGITNTIKSEAFQIGYFAFYDPVVTIYNTRGHSIKFGSLDSNGGVNSGAMSAKDAYAIDTKIDDGLASSGRLYGRRVATNCTDGASSADSVTYNLNDTTIDCILHYWQAKF